MSPVIEDPIARALVGLLDRSTTGFAIVREVSVDQLDWVYINDANAKMLGYTVAEMMAIPVYAILSPTQQSAMKELAAHLRSDKPFPAAIELVLVDKAGAPVTVELAMYRHAPYVACLIHSSRAESSSLSLLEADRVGLVGALSAGFAHEINNPLTSVLLNLRALRRQLASHPEHLQTVDDITSGAERIANNVRAFQSLASRGARRPIDLASIVSSALRLAAPTLAPYANIVRRILPVPPVIGEESRVGQAVLAMMLFSVSGFVKDSPSAADHRVTVHVESRGRDAVVEVSDNGRDLPAAEAARAFDPFFRSQVRGAGVGVGLGVARSVATTLGGEVTLEPRAGGGAVITMRLPTENPEHV